MVIFWMIYPEMYWTIVLGSQVALLELTLNAWSRT